ncbi:MAG TPA: DJ-1/PfpI family protein, partial [Albitalea sp.]|nr:DJ-1/PfpI family protein [Albitalea sp.]
TQPGPIRMFPAPMNIQPQATTAAFDARFPQGADYVIVPAVHRDDDPTLVGWVAAQARKGATIVGVCDGVWVLAHAGLLEGRQATGHWYSFDDLKQKFPGTQWRRHKRYIADGRVVTTTGVTATIPISLALVEAIAGHRRAAALATELGHAPDWSSEHPSERFRFDAAQKLTVAGNFVAFWSHEDVGIPLDPGVDEIALALEAEVYSATFRSKAYTVAQRNEPVRTRRGLLIVPDRAAGGDAPRRMLPAPDATRPLGALDQALKGIANDYGPRTASWVALQMEYPGY